MSDPRISNLQCRTIREAGINFKSKETRWDNNKGGTVRESGTIRENTVCNICIRSFRPVRRCIVTSYLRFLRK